MTYEEFKLKLKEEILKKGGNDQDFELISKELIVNAIKNERSPEDVAWALLQ